MSVALLVVGLVWWYSSGTFLHASGGGYGQLGVVDQQYSFGIQLETASGPSVRLDGVSASYPKDLQVSWSVYSNRPDEMGFGMWQGSLGPRWPTVAVHSYRVAQPSGHPELGGTWLVGSVRGDEARRLPRLTHHDLVWIRMRTRRVSAGGTDMCLLAAQPADFACISRQVDAFVPEVTAAETVDPLVAEYEGCSNP